MVLSSALVGLLSLASAAPTADAAASLTTPTPAEPVIGGQLVDVDAWTSVVAIVHINAFHPNSSLASVDLCSGVLLDAHTILTAGHCLLEISDIKNMVVVFGDRLDTDNPNYVGTVDSYAVHPDYCIEGDECGTDAYDFGVVTIAEKIGGVEFIPPLIDQTEWDEAMVPGGRVTVVGFGATREAQEDDPPLEEDEIGFKREVEIQIQSLTSTGHEFVAGNTGKDVCGGDSGGPVFVKAADGSFRLTGIVSRGVIPCGTGESYYGTVFAALPWIRDEFGLDLLPKGCKDLEDYDACLDTRPPNSGSGCRVTRDGDDLGIGLLLLALLGIRRRRARATT